jgi:hypothetical protein
MKLVEQVRFRKGKCLVQSVEEFVGPRGFVKEEGACAVVVVAGILLAFRVIDNDYNDERLISASLCTF